MAGSLSLNPLVQAVEPPPIAEAQRWAAEAGESILDTAQAVPAYPPAPALRRHLAAAMERDDPHFYTAILGLPALREALAGHMSAVYGGAISPGRWRSQRAATRPSAWRWRPWRAPATR